MLTAISPGGFGGFNAINAEKAGTAGDAVSQGRVLLKPWRWLECVRAQ